MGEELTEADITALADAFPVGPKARTLLRMAGFPAAAVPSMIGVNPADFWSMVADEIAAGTLASGRTALLTAAARRHPHNPAFRLHATLPTAGDPGRLRVLVVGASPGGLPRVRADREARAILDAAGRGHLTVELCPAAQAADLIKVRAFRPHILHLSCHGDGENLVFEDVHGDEHRVPAETVATVLRHVRDTGGVTLQALILGSCHSDRTARAFTPVATHVIAHRADLDDTCAVVFTEHFYKHLEPGADIPRTAHDAAKTALLVDETCASVATSLLVLPDHP